MSKDSLTGIRSRRVSSSILDVPSDRNEQKASEHVARAHEVSKSPPPIPRKSTLRNKQRSITIIEPSSSSAPDVAEHHSVSEPGHSSASIHSASTHQEESPTASQRMPLLSKPSQPQSSNFRLSWVDPPFFPSTSEPLRRTGRSASTSNLPNTNVPSGPNKLRKVPPRTVSVSGLSSSESGSRLFHVFRIRRPSTILNSFRGSSTTTDKGGQTATSLAKNDNDASISTSKRSPPPPHHSSSASGSLITVSRRSSEIPVASTAATTPDICPPSTANNSPFIPPPSQSRSLYAAHSKSLPSVTSSQLGAIPLTSRRSKRKPAPSMDDLNADTPSPAKSPVAPDTTDTMERASNLRRNNTRNGSKRRFWRSSTSVDNRRARLSISDLNDFLLPVRPEAPFHLDIVSLFICLVLPHPCCIGISFLSFAMHQDLLIDIPRLPNSPKNSR